MNYLVAKLKGKKGEILKILSTEEKVFEQTYNYDSKKYDPRYKLEDDEMFVLNNFSESHYKNDLIGQSFNTVEYNQIKTNQYREINFLCCAQGELLFFQKMSSNQLYKKKWFQISDTPDLMKNVPILVINDNIDAVYNTKKDTLYFRDIARIKAIFPGVEELYREATVNEVKAFLNNDFIKLTDDYSADKVKTSNRKRIALVIDAMKKYSKKEQNGILKYINEYCPNIEYKNSAFHVGNEEDLKHVLYGLEERYYTTIRTKEKRVANSVTTIA